MKKKDWQRRLDDVIKVCNNITIKHALRAQKAEIKAELLKKMKSWNIYIPQVVWDAVEAL